MVERAEVPGELVRRLAEVCLALPEAYQERAWVGVRWRIRSTTFAHVLPVSESGPPAYARAAAPKGPMVVLTFRSSGEELHALRHAGPPYFPAQWSRHLVGRSLSEDGAEVDWDELAELLTESYCTVAPKKLLALVARPNLNDS